jgi:hypothetical protein
VKIVLNLDGTVLLIGLGAITGTTKKRNNSTLTDEIIIKKKKLFEKDSPTKRRPSIAADVVDILSDLQIKNYVSANQVRDVLRRTGEFWSNFEYCSREINFKAKCD